MLLQNMHWFYRCASVKDALVHFCKICIGVLLPMMHRCASIKDAQGILYQTCTGTLIPNLHMCTFTKEEQLCSFYPNPSCAHGSWSTSMPIVKNHGCTYTKYDRWYTLTNNEQWCIHMKEEHRWQQRNWVQKPHECANKMR